MDKENRILWQEHKLPVSVADLCKIITVPFELKNLDGQTVLSEIVVSDNAEISQGCLFIPYYETDEFCLGALKKGASALLADHMASEDCPCILTPDPVTAVYDICQWMWDSIRLPAIAVAGSEGKTTTKRMIRSVLATEKKVFSQAGNYNSLQGLCCSLQQVENNTEIIVQEVDEARKNNTSNCSKVLRQKIAVITNVAEAHMARLNGKEGIYRSFRGITDGMPQDGIVLINGDDAGSAAVGFSGTVIRASVKDRSADCVADNIVSGQDGVEFDITYQQETARVRLRIPGVHNVYNAMMAFIVGKLENISTEHILQGLYAYQNSGFRQNACRIRDILVYADCYNASTTSIQAAIRTFDEAAEKMRKKVAVLGDIAEIEGYEDEIYRQIAEIIDHSQVDGLLTYGKESYRINSFVERNIEKLHANDFDQAAEQLQKLKKKGYRSFLFKGSRFMQMENIIKVVFPEHAESFGILKPQSKESIIKKLLRKLRNATII